MAPSSQTDAAARPGRLAVGIVGAGRVGTALGNALRAAGHHVVGASGISEASKDRIAAHLPGVPVLEVPEILKQADLVLLTVPDAALAALVTGLAEVGAWRAGQIAVHTCGRYGTRVLDPARAAGVIPLAIHPAMTFTGTSLDVARLEGTTFAVTGPAPVLPIGQVLVVEIGGEPVIVTEENRALYHAALAHGANHLVVLVAQAAEALAAAGVDKPGRALAPLLAAALDGATRYADATDSAGVADGAGGAGAIGALTGPVARGDAAAVTEHLHALRALARDHSALDIPDSYAALSRGATRRALVAGTITTDAATALFDALETTPDASHEGHE